eukprot:TRINITY_DN52556_c0_g1_i1.p2 TRINITY_DN52556_c0_g1~~TRINITY_DN52556_c0_g1_i1.p2  ORF type:complete len:386 (-),score=9.04 TRINITY_DN52556_c0_g1_i1:1268-2257(-)
MAAPAFSKFGKIVPQLALFDLPFLFKDIDHLHRVQDGEVGQKLKDMVTDKGYVALSFWDNGFKQLSSSQKPLVLPEDAQGQKFRIMSSKVLEAQFHAVGANPQMMPFSEVYSGLQQGVIDAAENPISNIYTKKFHEVQKYLTISDHGYLGYLVVLSKKFWNSLPADLQEDVKQAMNEATEKERQLAADLNNEQFNLIKEYADSTGKLEILHLTDEQKEAWRTAVSKIYPEFYDNNKIGEDLIKGALNTKQLSLKTIGNPIVCFLQQLSILNLTKIYLHTQSLHIFSLQSKNNTKKEKRDDKNNERDSIECSGSFDVIIHRLWRYQKRKQ